MNHLPASPASTSKGASLPRVLQATSLVTVLVLITIQALGLGAQRAYGDTGAFNPYVVHISVDGLKPQVLQQLLTAGQAPNFQKLMNEGAWTLNARTDYDYTITLPNHTDMLTGRSVNDKYGISNSGHHWTTNTTPPAGTTLQSNAGYYIASAFDVAHDNGFSTGLYASKDKFVVFRDTYNATNGAPDVTGPDNGRNKIDVYVNNDLNSTAMFNTFLTNMAANPTNYTFVHFNDTDTAGHSYGWGSTQYQTALMNVDAKLGQLFNLIANSPQMNGNTTIILSADHGGSGTNHSTVTNVEHYTIEFMLWGPDIPANTDLYVLNGSATTDPGTSRVDFVSGLGQPIRNGDGGNCALRRLGLSVTIPGSIINNLTVACPTRQAPATPTPTATSTATNTPEPTATATNTPEPTATATSTATNTPEPTATATNTPESTATATSTSMPATATSTPLPTATATSVATNTPAPTATNTSMPATATSTPIPVTPTPSGTSVHLIYLPSVWRYWDQGTDLGTSWQALNFDASTWALGASPLGYGDPVSTTVSYGSNASNKYVTTYFRQKFLLGNPADYNNWVVKLRRDDGIVVYINGVEVVRDNMPAGVIGYRTFAPTYAGDDGNTVFTFNIPSNVFVQGENIVAVEVHQNAVTSTDLRFELSLSASFVGATATPIPTVPATSTPLPTATNTPLPTATPGLPAGWTSQDIGSPGASGSAQFDGAAWTIYGSGTDIWGRSDKFRYTYQTVSGNTTIVARVNSVQNTNEWAKAGVMFRNGTAANAAFAMLIMRPDRQAAFQWRTGAGRSASWTGALVGGTSAIKWLKLTRSGNVIRAYYSTAASYPTSAQWVQVGNGVTVNMSSPRAGLAVTSHNNPVLAQAVFTDVTVQAGVIP